MSIRPVESAEELNALPFGSIVQSGDTVWFVYGCGKCDLLYPTKHPLDTETEDLDWFLQFGAVSVLFEPKAGEWSNPGLDELLP